MDTMIFVNLPVEDLQRSTAFYTGLGYQMNPQFSDENATSVVISDTIHLMLLTKPFFSTFTNRPVADAKAQTEVILALSADSKEGVDDLLSKALASGGQEPREPQDMGFMYSRTFQDPDGHIWETMYMDMSQVPQ
jgi:predicted lactoylglutathione lyase